MKKRVLRKLRSLLVELERNNTKIPRKLETLLQSSMKICIATLGHLPKIGVRVKLTFKAPPLQRVSQAPPANGKAVDNQLRDYLSPALHQSKVF